MSRPERPVQIEVGQAAPDFKAQDMEGKRVTLRTLRGEGKTLLVFYRGEWCPVSKKELTGLARDIAKFKESSSQIIAVSSAGLQKSKDLVRRLRLPYVVLSDPEFEAINLYGVRVVRSWIKDDQGGGAKGKLNEMMLLYTKGVNSYAVPSLFAIDGQGFIRWRYLSWDAPDYPENEEVLSKLREI